MVAYGACACTGGINALKNHQDDFHEAVYGEHARDEHLLSGPALPISAAIKVDYSAYGCPVNKYEVLKNGIDAATVVNPLPHVLMLTAIVVSVSVTGVALAVMLRIYREYGTLEEDEILEKIGK